LSLQEFEIQNTKVVGSQLHMPKEMLLKFTEYKITEGPCMVFSQKQEELTSLAHGINVNIDSRWLH